MKHTLIRIAVLLGILVLVSHLVGCAHGPSGCGYVGKQRVCYEDKELYIPPCSLDNSCKAPKGFFNKLSKVGA